MASNTIAFPQAISAPTPITFVDTLCRLARLWCDIAHTDKHVPHIEPGRGGTVRHHIICSACDRMKLDV